MGLNAVLKHIPILDELTTIPDDEFERAFAREILISERKRMLVLAVLMGLGQVFYGVAIQFFPELFTNLGITDVLLSSLVVFCLTSTYLLGARLLLGHLLHHNRQPPKLARYVNALIETSVPTLVLLLLTARVGPVEGLIGPPTVLYFVLILLATMRLDFGICLFTGVVAAVEYLLLSAYYWEDIQRLSPLVLNTSLYAYLGRAIGFLLAGLLAGFVSVQLKDRFASYVASLEERNQLVNMFGQHLSPAVVNKLLAQGGEFESEVRTVCLMFLDVRDFTTFSEQRSPEEVVTYLNTLFATMIERVNAHHGIINKFLGDGFLAIFGAPFSEGNDCQNAVSAALEIVAAVGHLEAAGRIPPTRIGIGLHAGEVVTGNVGSLLRKEYTVIGDTVNLAARIEQLNKQMGSQLLVSESVWERLGDVLPPAEALAPLQVRGRAMPVRIFKLA